MASEFVLLLSGAICMLVFLGQTDMVLLEVLHVTYPTGKYSYLNGVSMSFVGFILGAIAALIFYGVATALVAFQNSHLVFGLIALLIWAYFTFAPGPWTTWQGPRR
jgi:hypothetical protein